MVDIKEKIEKGHIHGRVIIQVIGKPKEHVEQTIKGYVQKIKDETNVEVLSEDYDKVNKHDEELFSSHAELEMLVKDIYTFIGFCFDYMPASIEIIEPKEFSFQANQIGSILNALQGRLHQLDMLIKQKNAENKFMKQNSHILISNMISLILHNNKMESKRLSDILGIQKQELDVFLEHLVKEKRLIKEGSLYTLNAKNE